MKKFFALFVIVFGLIVPSLSQAFIFLPTVTVTIVKNTEGGEGIFHFQVTDTTVFANEYDSFDLATQNNTGSHVSSVVAFGTTSFYVRETVPSDWQVKSANVIIKS